MGLKVNETLKLAFQVIQSFPKNKSGKPYLTLSNNRKCFFKIFIKKYGLDSTDTSYTKSDLLRRVRLVEFFDYFVKDYPIRFLGKNKSNYDLYIIESNFYKMVLIDTRKDLYASELQILSFYPR